MKKEHMEKRRLLAQMKADLDDMLESTDGEITPGVQGVMEDIDKLENEVTGEDMTHKERVIWRIKREAAEIALLAAEKKRIDEKKKSKEKQLEQTRAYLMSITEDKENVGTHKVYHKKSQSVAIDNAELLPDGFVKVEKKRTPDKSATRVAIKGGADVPGARLDDNVSLVLK